jgi:polyisoprenoid-binding protein YceI
MRTTLLFLAATLLGAGALSAAPQEFKADKAHSSVTFKIRHFFTKVPGSFAEMDATIKYDESDPSKSSATAQIDVTSVDTNNSDRDEHLASDDFFSASNHPTMTFESTEWKVDGDNQFSVTGNLSMNGETKPVTLDVTLLGMQPNQDGVMVSGWEISGELDRRDWGITYGQGIVGNEVEFEALLQAPQA